MTDPSAALRGRNFVRVCVQRLCTYTLHRGFTGQLMFDLDI